MDKGFKKQVKSGKEGGADKGAKEGRVTKTIKRYWRFLCRKQKLILDVAIFAAAAGAIYVLGDKISQAFIEQLPSADLVQGQNTMSMPEPE